MAEKSTYIKIDRNITKWRWWKNHNTVIVFLWLLLNANVSDHEFEHEMIHRGEVATSLKTIASQGNLTINETRTAISHLKSTGEITTRIRSHYQVITIVEYNKYQDVPSKSTGKSQRLHNQITTTSQQYKHDKHDKHEKNNSGRSAPGSPAGELERGTDKFRAKSHLLLKRDEGTVDDIPVRYRKQYSDFAAYWDWRNQ